MNFSLRNSIQLLLLNMKLHEFACLIHKKVCTQRDGFFSVACLLRPVKWCNIVVLLDNNNRNKIYLIKISNNHIMSSFIEAFYFEKHYWNNIEINNFSHIPVPDLALWVLIIICALRNHCIKNIAFAWSIKSTVKNSLTSIAVQFTQLEVPISFFLQTFCTYIAEALPYHGRKYITYEINPVI